MIPLDVGVSRVAAATASNQAAEECLCVGFHLDGLDQPPLLIFALRAGKLASGLRANGEHVAC